MNYTDTQFRSFFQGNFDEQTWMDMLRNLFQVEHLRLEKEAILATENAYFYGSTTTADHYSIGFFRYDIDAENIARRRVSLRQLVKPFINERWGQFDGAIVVYTARKDWRISFICDLSNERTSPKRFTFLLGDPKCQYNTAVGRFRGLQDKGISFGTIRDAFSVEQLTKEFYNELLNWYDWITKDNSDITVTFPSDVTTIDDDQEKLGEKTIRLITRIMFVWFIKQKQLVPDELFDAEKINDVLKDFDPKSTTNGNYYNAILQNLFFATLNCEPKKRCFASTTDRDIKTRYLYAEMFEGTVNVKDLFKNVPYLNGGLFECLDKYDVVVIKDGKEKVHDVFYDGFDDNDERFKEDPSRPKYRAVVPNCVFFDESRGLLPILKKYNFTIEENSTDDQTIALDPELLGKVFENLLAVYNPETKESARKESGSFYTPREIVDYMCKEAVIAYLGDRATGRECRDFVENGNVEGIDCAEVLEKLKKIKIFDPACGSGAFPMGLLNLLDSLIETLEPTANRYERKLQIIQNSIYGADIQCIAVQITKLRFFISLVCDAGNDIQPLPNLETKFVAANSLIDLKSENRQLSLFNVDELKEQLFRVRAKHFATRSVSDKIKLREQDEQLRGQLLEKLTSGVNDVQAQQMAHWDPYDQNNSAEFFNPSWMFGVDNFDIIIGNPPYGATYDAVQKKYFLENYKTARTTKINSFQQKGSLDTFTLFIERGFNLLRTGGAFGFIVPISLVTSDSLAGIQKMLTDNCQTIHVSSYAARPEQIFKNAMVDVSILQFKKTDTPCEKLYSTKMYRKGKGFSLQNLIDNLEFTDVHDLCLYGRIPKIGKDIERSILTKISCFPRLKDYATQDGKPIYYRSSGGRYYNVITNYSTGSTKEKDIVLQSDYCDSIGAILSSTLGWWFYMIHANNHDWKSYEILNTPICPLTDENKKHLTALYDKYLQDIEKNARVHESSGNSTYKVATFKEYKIVYSKAIIDEIDDYIGPLYGLTSEEINFIKNYELDFRLSGQ